MVTINTLQIRETYFQLSTIDIIIQEKIDLVNRNKSNLDKIVVSEAKNLYSQKENKSKEYIDNVVVLAYENGIVALVSVFEKLVFDLYDNAKGEIKKVIKENTPTAIPYYKSREKFIKEESNLADIVKFLDGIVNTETLESFKSIKIEIILLMENDLVLH